MPRVRAIHLRYRLLAAVLATGALGGCMKPLFPEDKPRTQFETYDRMRARYIPLEEPDVFGTPRPALRARLGQTTVNRTPRRRRRKGDIHSGTLPQFLHG